MLELAFHALRDARGSHRCQCDRRIDSVDSDSRWPEFDRRRPSHRDDSALTGAVDRGSDCPDICERGGREDDRTAGALGLHLYHLRLEAKECRFQIRVDYTIPGFLVQRLNRAASADTCIVECAIEASVTRDDLRYEARNARRFRQIDRNKDCMSARSMDLGDDALAFRFSAAR